MCNESINLIPALLDSLSQAQRKSNAEILPIVYRIIDAPAANTPEKTVQAAAQRFLDFYLSNTALAEDACELNMRDYYDALVKNSSGLFFALDVMSGEFYEGAQVEFATAMNNLFATYREYFMALDELYEDECDCDDDDCDDEDGELDDKNEYMDCHACSADCETCRGCCDNANDEATEAQEPTSKSFSELLDEAILETRKNNEQPEEKDVISDSEAAARLLEAIFGIKVKDIRRVLPKEEE